jgi:tetratricopeptide (TPR) repeat protein
MKKSFFYSFLAAFLLLAGNSGIFAAELPYSKIKNLYNEGEFEKIRLTLDDFLKKSGKAAQPKEKIFAYKYLGVIYAAEPEGYPLAETYFYQMLTLAPNAHISDMYVSSTIENLFNKTQARFQRENRVNSEFDEFGNRRAPLDTGMAVAPAKRDSTIPIRPRKTDSIPAQRPLPHKERTISAWTWVLGGGVVLIAAGLYWYLSQEKNESHVTDGGKL